MKTFVCVAMGIMLIFTGCSDPDLITSGDNDAQLLKSASKGTGYTEQFYKISGEDDYWLPVICNGVEVDYLVGDGIGLTAHVITHYEYGEKKWMKVLISGSITSVSTGETFVIHESNRHRIDKEEGYWYIISNTNALGDQGTHYVFSAKYIYASDPEEEDTLEDVRAMCVPENSKSKKSKHL